MKPDLSFEPIKSHLRKLLRRRIRARRNNLSTRDLDDQIEGMRWVIDQLFNLDEVKRETEN